MAPRRPEPDRQNRGTRGVFARVTHGQARVAEGRFTQAFTIGSSPACDIQVVGPELPQAHAEVMPDGILWWIRDLSGGPGTYVNGARAQMVPLRDRAEVELGKGGPRVQLTVQKEGRDSEEDDVSAPDVASPGPAKPAESTVPSATAPIATVCTAAPVPGTPAPVATVITASPVASTPAPVPTAAIPAVRSPFAPAVPVAGHPVATAIQPIPSEVSAAGPVTATPAVSRARAAQPARPAPAPPGPRPDSAASRSYGGFTSETQILRRFLGKKDKSGEGETEPASNETVLFRRAFERVKKRSSLPYQILASVVLTALLLASGVIIQQQRKLSALRETAERLFYASRALEVEVAQLEELVLAHTDRKVLGALLDRKAKYSRMEAEYDTFVKELGVYAKARADEQLIMRQARAFGECDVRVPEEFVSEVRRYIQKWKSSGRLASALQRSATRGYGPAIQRVFAEAGLPPQYVYLPLQESGYDERAVGPPTRFGHAKGMWQFISATASRYGLKVGPLYDQPAYDPRDERFEWQKATTAAMRYIKELSASDAQASGLLVLACYNWGEDNVREVVRSLPATPQDRNFWRLLRDKRIPAETYDYVLSIFSAAVICEDPKLFGFELTCPAMQELTSDPAPSPEPVRHTE
jgi:pSer/pThr/pTyr-binding forkhead associated (FHA) protein